MERKRNWIRRMDTRLLFGILAVSAALAVYAAIQLSTGLRAYAQAGTEYDSLRREYGPDSVLRPVSHGAEPVDNPAGLNPDYVGWIRIDGTALDYPVVQGKDNEKYLATTFEGKENKLGAIFLDFRCMGGLESPHAILYGHNARDGSMFGSLLRYQEEGYLERHPEIRLILPDGSEETYRIFAVKATDIADPAYQSELMDSAAFDDFARELGAPDGTGRIITLSTCLDNSSMDSRLLIHAAQCGS